MRADLRLRLRLSIGPFAAEVAVHGLYGCSLVCVQLGLLLLCRPGRLLLDPLLLLLLLLLLPLLRLRLRLDVGA